MLLQWLLDSWTSVQCLYLCTRMRDRSPEEGGAGPEQSSGAGLARLQEPPSGSAPPPSDSGDTGDSSDWNKRLMQVQEQMRQLNQQIQMLVEESAARRKRRTALGGAAPGSVKKKPLVSPVYGDPSIHSNARYQVN